MDYIKSYKVFESNDINKEEISELIEDCKDIVETFNESEDNFKISNYNTGFATYDTYYGVGDFRSRQTHESDMAVIKFNLGLLNDLDNGNFKSKEKVITPERIDELIKLLNKSKFLVQRLSRYCPTIHYELSGKSIRFMLVFTNPDDSGSKNAKVRRLYDKLSEDLKDYTTWKTMNIVLFPSSNNRFPERYKKLYNLIKTNSNLIDGRYGQWDETRRSDLELRFACSELINDNNIIINVSGFKYKTCNMDRFKSIRLSNDEKSEAMKCIEQKVKNSLSRDIDSIETSIDGNKIKIKIR